MAVIFSKVTLVTEDLETQFFACGIPKDAEDLEPYTRYHEFADEIDSETEIFVHVDTHLYTEDLIRNAVVFKERNNLVYFGYRAGENRFTYPKYGRAKAEDFLQRLCGLVDVVVIDCPSDPESNVLATVGLEWANQIIRLASPDLRSISYYLSQIPAYSDSKYRLEEHIQGLITVNEEVFMPVEEAKAHLKRLRKNLKKKRPKTQKKPKMPRKSWRKTPLRMRIWIRRKNSMNPRN